MADISGLSLQPPARIEGPYQDKGEYVPPAPEGTYLVQAPDTFEFKGDKNGNLGVVNLKLTVCEGQPGSGSVLFDYISTMKSKFREGNTACDYLRAHGIDIVPETNEQYADLIESTAGRVLKVATVWEAYDSDADETVLKGQDKFPPEKDPATGQAIVIDGVIKRSFRAISPSTKKEVLARAKVKRYVSAVVAQA